MKDCAGGVSWRKLGYITDGWQPSKTKSVDIPSQAAFLIGYRLMDTFIGNTHTFTGFRITG